jgi:hypothetical protein
LSETSQSFCLSTIISQEFAFIYPEIIFASVDFHDHEFQTKAKAFSHSICKEKLLKISFH